IREEFDPPAELAATDRYSQQNQANALQQGFIAATVDPSNNALVCAMARARHAKVVPAAEILREQRLGEILAAGPKVAAEATRWRLLNDPDSMARLHEHVWLDEQHRDWRQAYEPR